MASTYSALKIELIATGEQSGTWGATTNVNLGDAALGEAITGSADVAFSSADVTVTLVDTNATQTARNLRLNLTGTSGGARNLILGSGCQIEKLYLVNNGLADAVTVKNTTGTGIAVPAGKTMFVYNNGTNVVDAITHLTSLTTGVLSASGATTFTAGTASTSTTTGTAVITGGLGVSGRVNAANFDGIVGANTAAAGSFTTINASTSITNAGLTSGRVTYAGTAGLLQDSANLLYSGTDLTVYGLTVGRGAGAVFSNTAVGASALAGANTGGFTTALGYQAGISNTSGQNTFVGANSGQYVTTGTRNTGVGVSTLGFNNGAVSITSNDNTGYGHAALTGLTSGASNTAIGSYALQANTTASNNTAVGYQAGYSNTTGTSNVFMGWATGYNNSTGSSNTFIGIEAGRNSTSGSNTFIGNTAGYSVTTGIGNTFIGGGLDSATVGSGYRVTTGSKNTILGNYDGNQGGLDIRTASSFVVLSDGDGNPVFSTYVGASAALNGAVPQAGTGITFPATQLASANANTLDDYEEGTFTPILGTSNGGTATMSLQEGKYVKVGKIVQFSLQITWTAKNTWDFNTRISGLPFTATLNTGGYIWPNACQMDANALTVLFIYGIESNSTYGYIQVINATGAQLTETSFPASGRVLVNGCYQTT